MLLVCVLAFGYLCYVVGVLPLKPPSNSQATPDTLTLENMPPRYCPKKAEVLLARSGRLLADDYLAIQSCSQLNLAKILNHQSGELKLYVHLPDALAFSLNPANQPLSYSPVLGDVNRDNLINGQDEQLVSAALFSQSSQFDVDGDGRVTISDLALVKMGTGVGVSRPDNVNWSQSL